MRSPIGKPGDPISPISVLSKKTLYKAPARHSASEWPPQNGYSSKTILDEPMEKAVSGLFGIPASRDRIVEIGAHASSRSRATVLLWARAARHLNGEADIAVAVLTAPLRAMFNRLGIAIHEICDADPARLSNGGIGWGRYYEQKPQVCAGLIAPADAGIDALRGIEGPLRMTVLLDVIRSHADRENAAFDDGHYPIGWKEAARTVERTAALIRESGLGGRPVGLFLDHSTAGSILLVAMMEAGVPIVPLPPFFTYAQRDAFLDHAGATVLITSCVLDGSIVRFATYSRDAAPADLPDGTAVISFSSGSTGEPKGVCLSADHLTDVAVAVCNHLGRSMAGQAPAHSSVRRILLEQVAGLFASVIAGGTYCPQPSDRVGLANPLKPHGRGLLKAIARHSATSLILRARISGGACRRDGGNRHRPAASRSRRGRRREDLSRPN